MTKVPFLKTSKRSPCLVSAGMLAPRPRSMVGRYDNRLINEVDVFQVNFTTVFSYLNSILLQTLVLL